MLYYILYYIINGFGEHRLLGWMIVSGECTYMLEYLSLAARIGGLEILFQAG